MAAPTLPADAPPIGGADPGAEGAPVGDDPDRIARLEEEVRSIRGDLDQALPAVKRLVRIEGDIRVLLVQLEQVVGAKADQGVVSASNVPAFPTPAPLAAPPERVEIDSAGPPEPAPTLALTIAAPAPGGKADAKPPTMPASAETLPSISAGSIPSLPVGSPAPPKQTRTSPLPDAPTPAPGQSTPPGEAAGVHLASYRQEARARAGWDELRLHFGEELSSLSSEIRAVDIGSAKGPYLRLIAGPLSRARAKTVCEKLKASGQYCQITDFRTGG